MSLIIGAPAASRRVRIGQLPPTYDQVIALLGPSHLWMASALDEDNVTIPDLIGTNDMTISGTLDTNYYLDDDPDVGSVIRFQGAQALSDSSISWSGGLSLEIALMYGVGYSTNGGVVGQGSASSSFRYDIASNKHRGLIFDGTNKSVSSASDRALSAWTHVLLAYDTETLELFVNGASEGTVAAGTESANPMRWMRNTFNTTVNPGPVSFRNVVTYGRRLNAGEASLLFDGFTRMF